MYYITNSADIWNEKRLKNQREYLREKYMLGRLSFFQNLGPTFIIDTSIVTIKWKYKYMLDGFYFSKISIIMLHLKSDTATAAGNYTVVCLNIDGQKLNLQRGLVKDCLHYWNPLKRFWWKIVGCPVGCVPVLPNT